MSALIYALACVISFARRCRLSTNGLSSIGLQRVSVRLYAWPRSTHSLGMVWDLTCNDCFALWLRVCCRVAPCVADMLCCSSLSAVEQWPTSNGLQRVSAPRCGWRRSARALNVLYTFAIQRLLAPWPCFVLHHTWLTCCIAPGCRLFTRVRPGGECGVVCMAVLDPLSTCSPAAYLLLCYTTCG